MHPPRRSFLIASALLVAASVLSGVAPSPTQAIPVDVRHFYDADQIGSTADDTVTDVTDQLGHTAYTGTTAGDLPGETNQGGLDSFVRMGTFDLVPHPGPFQEIVTRQLGGPGDDVANAVTTDGSLTVVGGATDGDLVDTSAGGQDGWIWAVDRDGEDVWSEQLGGAGDDAVLDLASDPDGNVWVAGHVGDQGFVRRYDAEGDLLWERTEGLAVTHLALHQYYVPVNAYRLLMVVEQPSSEPGGETSRRVRGFDALTGDPHGAGVGLGPVSVTGLATDTSGVAWVSGWTGSGVDEDAYVTGVTLHPLGRQEARVTNRLPVSDGADRATSVAWDGRQTLVTVQVDGQPNDTLVSVDRDWSRPLPPGFATSAAVAYTGRFAGYTASYPLIIGGATDAALTGTNAGGTDAAIARYLTWQPDAMATRKGAWPPIKGGHTYGPAYDRLMVPVRGLETSTARLLAGNNGDITQRLRIRSCTSHDGYRIRYRHDGRDMTRPVTRGTYLTGPLGVDERGYVKIEITPVRRTTGLATCDFVVTSPTGGERDWFRLVIRRKR